MVETVNRITQAISRVLMVIAIGSLVIMTTLISVMVVTRYGFGYVIRGTEEMTLLLMIWSALLGAAVVVRERQHICVTFLVRRFPIAVQCGLRVLFSLVILVYLVYLTRYGVIQAIRNLADRSSALQIPMFWWYTAIYVSSGLMILFVIGNLINDISCITTPKAAASVEAVSGKEEI